MTLLGMWSFDDLTGVPGATLTGGAMGNANARTGVGGSLRLTTSATATLTLASATASPIFGVGISSDSYGTTKSFVQFNEGATVHLSLRLSATNQIQLYRGDGTTLLQTSTWTMPATSTWAYLEIKATIADAGGAVEVWAEGASILTYSGDTRNAGTAGTIDSIRLATPNNTASNTWFDDAVALNTSGSAPLNNRLGDVAVRTLLPNNNGDSSQWVGSDGNSTNNYQLVDEAASSMSDYVGSNVSGNADLYAITDVPTTADVLAIQTLVYAAKSDAGTAPVAVPIAKGQAGTTRNDTALPTLSTTATVYASDTYTTDPDGNALTAARVNAMQVGVKIA